MDVLDKGKLGAMMRYMRTSAGYANADDFARAMTKLVGYRISKETVYKYESGAQEPKLSAFVAAQVLCKKGLDDQMLRECLSGDGNARKIVEESKSNGQ